MKSKLKVPYGFEGVVISTDLYSSKILIIKQGEQTPYVYNKKQDKTIYVLQGIVNLTIDGTTRTLSEGDRCHIKPTIMHRLHAIQGDATILETGTKIEDDAVEVQK